jgi:hypothetical protein
MIFAANIKYHNVLSNTIFGLNLYKPHKVMCVNNCEQYIWWLTKTMDVVQFMQFPCKWMSPLVENHFTEEKETIQSHSNTLIVKLNIIWNYW